MTTATQPTIAAATPTPAPCIPARPGKTDLAGGARDVGARLQDAGPPASQDFWVAVAQGSGAAAAALNWKVREGDCRMVLMNAARCQRRVL